MVMKHNVGKGKREAGYFLFGVLVLLFTFTALTGIAAAETVSIGSTGAIPGASVTEPIMINDVTDLGAGTIQVSYNSSVVHVTAVTNGSGDALTIIAWRVNNSTNPGSVRISAYNTSGQTGDVIFADVTYEAVGAIGETSPLGITVDALFDIYYTDIAYSVTNGSFRVKDTIAPVVTNPSATPDVILNDNGGRPRAAGTNTTTLNVTVTDNDVGVASVTIDLSPIGGSSNQPMSLVQGTNMSGVWSVTTTATAESCINVTSDLVVNVTDGDDNSNISVSIPLEVLRRGDVKRDNVVNMMDMLYIARYTVELEPEVSNQPSVFIADVVGEAGNPVGDGKVDMKDALYIARRVALLEAAP